jgi:hypothetical protein
MGLPPDGCSVRIWGGIESEPLFKCSERSKWDAWDEDELLISGGVVILFSCESHIVYVTVGFNPSPRVILVNPNLSQVICLFIQRRVLPLSDININLLICYR